MKEKELVGFSSVSNEELVNVDGGSWKHVVCAVAMFLVMYPLY